MRARLASKGVLASCAPVHTEVSADYQFSGILNECRRERARAAKGARPRPMPKVDAHGPCTCETIPAMQAWREPRIIISQGHSGLFASARATGPHREFNKYLGAPKTQPDVELRRGSGSIEIKQFLSATSRETLFSGTDCPGLVIAPVYYYRRLLSPTSDTHIGLLSPPFSASATSWRLLGHQQAQF